MKIEHFDINDTIEKAKETMAQEKNMSSSTKAIFNLLITLITVLFNRLNLNSRNSSKPPSTDKNKKTQENKKKNNNRGGQNGHTIRESPCS